MGKWRASERLIHDILINKGTIIQIIVINSILTP